MLRGQSLVIAVLLTLLCVLFLVASFYSFYQSRLDDIESLSFPRRAAEATAKLI